MDNAVRFDDAVMVQNNGGAWSLNQESVDLNAYLYAEKGFLAEMADELGRSGEAEMFRAQADKLGEQIQTLMFDEEDGYFHDIRLEGKTPIRVFGPEGWIPLCAGVATPEQAARVRTVMTDTSTFATLVPFPTLAANHADFDPTDGYWRGPVWLDQAHFAVEALKRYGFDDEATTATRNLLNRPAGLTGSSAPIYENYHPHTREGLNAAHFSWSAAHVLMMVMDCKGGS